MELQIAEGRIGSNFPVAGTSCTTRQSDLSYSTKLHQIHPAFSSLWDHRLTAGLIEDTSRVVGRG